MKHEQQRQPQGTTLTNSTLIKYTLGSIIFAVIILFTVILPAEYNIDPTGLGHKLGLTVFQDDKKDAVDSSSLQKMTQEIAEKYNGITEAITVIVPAGRGVEYKFIMEQYQKLEYEWITDGTSLYFDLHGEPRGDTTGYFESYAIATLSEMKGSFTAPFAGSHGWYWKNTTDKVVTVQLVVTGQYSQHALK